MKRILVIDDDGPIRQAVRTLLRNRGYEVLEAASGNTGIELARAKLPDLILSDVDMPGLDGFDVLKALRSEPTTSAIPVVLMTGLSEKADVRSSMERGADDYLSKPFHEKTLIATVRARLERQDLIQGPSKANEARLLEILAATQDLVAIMNAETGHLLYLNRAGRDMLALALEMDISKLRLADFLEDSETTLTHRDRMVRARQDGLWLGEGTFVSREGRRVPVSKQILAHQGSGSEPGYLSVVARDISERKRAEQERQLMEVQLRQAQKIEAIGCLAAGIAHEINTPIQYIGDNTRFLKDAFDELNKVLCAYGELFQATKQNLLTPELLKSAETIIQDSDLEYLFEQIPAAFRESLEGLGRVTKIVCAMKEFSHPGNREKEKADLNKAIDTTVTVARNEWKYVAEMALEFAPGLPLVPCFVGEFNQVILNLVVNAVHAIQDAQRQNPAKGRIVIRTRLDGDFVEVSVADTGTGIPEKCRPRIFEPFFTTKEAGKGTGQGLSLAYASIVKKHGGALAFETEVGKGTTFKIRLPLAANSREDEPQRPLAQAIG